jgi:hypothetical protein
VRTPLLVLSWMLLLAAPGAGYWLMMRCLERLAGSPRRGRRGPAVPERSLAELVGDLQRLGREWEALQSSPVPVRPARMRAVVMAYDERLRDCCRVLGLPEPDPPPLDAIARLETEAALAQEGLSW